MEVCVVVLAGGRGRRLGDVDKAAVTVGGSTLLGRALAAAPTGARTLVVGPPRPGHDRATFVAEERTHGGPLSGLAAAVPQVEEPVLVLLAVDLPFAGSVVPLLLAALSDDADAVVAVDHLGFRQPLCAAYRTAALRDGIAALGQPWGRSMRDLLALLTVRELPIADPRVLADVDTAVDLERIRSEAEGTR